MASPPPARKIIDLIKRFMQVMDQAVISNGTVVVLRSRHTAAISHCRQTGKSVDALLTIKRDLAAAKRFLTKALGMNDYPEKVAMDKS